MTTSHSKYEVGQSKYTRKYCPFCGGTDLYPYVGYDFINRSGEEAHVIVCGTCGTCGPFGVTKVQARIFWNIRKEDIDICGKQEARHGGEGMGSTVSESKE